MPPQQSRGQRRGGRSKLVGKSAYGRYCSTAGKFGKSAGGGSVEGSIATGEQAAPARLSGDTGRFREPHGRARSSNVLRGHGGTRGERQAGRLVEGCSAVLVASLWRARSARLVLPVRLPRKPEPHHHVRRD